MRITSCPCLLSFVLLSCGGGQVSPGAPPSVSSRDAPERSVDAAPAPASAPGSGVVPDDAPGTSPSPVRSAEAGTGLQRRQHDPGRSPEDIRAIIVAHRDEARACYDKSLAKHPGIEGDLVVRWTIDPKGAVTQVGSDPARSQIFEPSLVSCIGDIVKKIQFAPSPKGFETKAFYPFNFHPRRTPANVP